jgi:dihydroorotate dehydrogenase (fumarate)
MPSALALCHLHQFDWQWLVIDPERECVVIKPKDGLGGLGGLMYYPRHWPMCASLSGACRTSMWWDAVASVVVGRLSCIFWPVPPRCRLVPVFMRREGAFARILQELAMLMEAKAISAWLTFVAS